MEIQDSFGHRISTSIIDQFTLEYDKRGFVGFPPMKMAADSAVVSLLGGIQGGVFSIISESEVRQLQGKIQV